MVGSRSSLRFRTGGLAWSRAWGRACGWAVAAALPLTAHPGAAQFEPIVPGPSEAVALELVLAVDASSSVSPEAFNMTMGGLAGADLKRVVQGTGGADR